MRFRSDAIQVHNAYGFIFVLPPCANRPGVYHSFRCILLLSDDSIAVNIRLNLFDPGGRTVSASTFMSAKNCRSSAAYVFRFEECHHLFLRRIDEQFKLMTDISLSQYTGGPQNATFLDFQRFRNIEIFGDVSQ